MECKAKFPTLWAQLTNPGSRTIENLTANICDMYEKPSAVGRMIDRRISYAKEVRTLFDQQTPSEPTAPTQIIVPPSIPQPVGQILIWLLNNVFTGGVSTTVGIVSLVYAWLVFSHTQIANIPINSDWKPWLAFGIVLIFGMGKQPQPEPAISAEALTPVQPQETSMNPDVILKVIGAIESFVPIIEKVLADIPQIQADIAQIKSALASFQTSGGAVDSQMADLVTKLNALTTAIHPTQP